MPDPTVHLLLATYQGEAYLQQQLDSLQTQTHDRWTLTISDDGSTDNSVGICQAFAARVRQPVRIVQGPRQQEATANFLHLMALAQQAPEHDLFACCDQDDIWLPEKLARAVRALQGMPGHPQQPRLYCGRTRLVDEQLRPGGLSPLPRKPLGFGNALLQNVVNGNTMVFNHALLRLLCQVQPGHAVLHDWTAYLAVTGCAGQWFFDPEPCLLYRQHRDNIVGAQHRPIDKVHRFRTIFQGRYRRWGDQTEAILRDLEPHLSASAQAQWRVFQSMRQAPSAWRRLLAGWRSGLWRQTRSGQLSLFIALACKQI